MVSFVGINLSWNMTQINKVSIKGNSCHKQQLKAAVYAALCGIR
jgi:hypothetical protein